MTSLAEQLARGSKITVTCPLCHRVDILIVWAACVGSGLVLAHHPIDVVTVARIPTPELFTFVTVTCPASGQPVQEVKP